MDGLQKVSCFFHGFPQTRTSIVCFPGGIFYIFCLKNVDWKLQDLRHFGAGTESPECLGVRKMCGTQKHKMRFKGFFGCCLWCKCINIRRLVDYIYWGGVGLRSHGSFGFYKSRVQVRSLHAGRYRRIDLISWTLYIEIFKKCHENVYNFRRFLLSFFSIVAILTPIPEKQLLRIGPNSWEYLKLLRFLGEWGWWEDIHLFFHERKMLNQEVVRNEFQKICVSFIQFILEISNEASGRWRTATKNPNQKTCFDIVKATCSYLFFGGGLYKQDRLRAEDEDHSPVSFVIFKGHV